MILRAGLIGMFCCSRIRQNSAMNNAHFRILANPATRHLSSPRSGLRIPSELMAAWI